MIIEIHTNIDSRFIIYDIVNILSRSGTVKWLTANKNVVDFNYDNNIDVEYVEQGYFAEVDNHVEDYIIYDNCTAATPNMIIHFIDPYSELNINNIGKNDKVVRVMEGIHKKKAKKVKGYELDEKQIFIEELLKKPCLKKLQTYENIYRFETMRCDLSTSTEFIKILILLGLAKQASMAKGGHREHSNEKLYSVLW